MTDPTTKQALLCIDMQNDFCLEGAPLQVMGAMACLPHCQSAVAAARQAGIRVFWVIREHDDQGAAAGPSCVLSECQQGASTKHHAVSNMPAIAGNVQATTSSILDGTFTKGLARVPPSLAPPARRSLKAFILHRARPSLSSDASAPSSGRTWTCCCAGAARTRRWRSCKQWPERGSSDER